MTETTIPLWTTFDLIAKFRDIEIEIASERGSFTLFIAIVREPDRFDLIVSAPWIGQDTPSAMKMLSGKLQSKLEMHELKMLGRIEILDPTEPFVQVWHRVCVTEHDEGVVFNNLTVRGEFGTRYIPQAYVITSKPVDAASMP